MKPVRIAIIILLLLLVSLAVVFFWPGKSSEPPSISELGIPPAALQETEPEIRYPLPQAQPASPGTEEQAIPPLPELGQSDVFTKDLLTQLFGEPARKQLLAPQQFIRRLVLIIDALPRKDLPRQHLPLRAAGGRFETAGEEGAKVIASANFLRYAPYVKLAEAAPTDGLAKAYLRVYPLLEEAYQEMGYPKGYFHDRMITVLDHLLATPEPKGPIPLVKHVTQYRYADPQLEALSTGQKTLLRMGSENARRIKAVLQKLRKQLVVPQPVS
ncbi:MAG: DUF3014 domain-containing protein [Desulfuromonadaceae bacterium]|nr:DUF3014 domain-containing protein [Desulfuromonadaceae bacterium]